MNTNMGENSFIESQRNNSFSKFLNLFTPKKQPETALYPHDGYELLECIKNARNEWIAANSNFEYAQGKELVDYYTYKIKACEIRYQYYLKKAKQAGLKADVIEQPGFLA